MHADIIALDRNARNGRNSRVSRKRRFERPFVPRLVDKVRITVGTRQQNDRLVAVLEDIVGNVSDRSSSCSNKE